VHLFDILSFVISNRFRRVENIMADDSIEENRSLKVYPSKKDTWLVVVIWAGAIVFLASSVVTVLLPLSFKLRLGILLLFIGLVFFVIWVLYSTFYVLANSSLIVRCGPFKWTVPLDTIMEVVPSRNSRSSPACSLDRFRIKYQGSWSGLLISPTDKHHFLQDLAERCPQLILDGDKLVRRDDT